MDDEEARVREEPEQQLLAHAAMGKVIRQVAGSIRGRPGRPRKGTVSRGQSLSRLDQASREADKGDLTLSRNTIYNWWKGRTVPQPRKYAALLTQTGKRGAAAVPYLAAFAPLWIQSQVERFIRDVHPALEAESGEAVHFRIDANVRVAADVISIGGTGPERELAEAQRLMANSTQKFGWIIDEPAGYIITAPSKPACELVGAPFEFFNGSCLLDIANIKLMREVLENFSEAVLLIGLMLSYSVARWRAVWGDSEAQHLERAEMFFGWLRRYVTESREEVEREIQNAPVMVFDQERRETLQRCLAAASGEGDWPLFVPGLWNSSRMLVKKHDLLPAGQIARFRKTHRPIPLDDPIGWELVWEPEEADPVANQLMRAILERLGYVGQPD